MTCPRCGRPRAGAGCDCLEPAATPPRRRKRLPLSGLSGAKYSSGWKVTVLALLGAAAVTSAVFWFASSSAEETMRKQGHFDNEVTIPPGKEFGYVLAVMLSSHYQFAVTPLDGPAVMAVGRVDDGDSEAMSPADLASVAAKAVKVEAGKVGKETGELSRGRYVWAVWNPSKDRPVRVKIKFD
jgi:hypothetical protein